MKLVVLGKYVLSVLRRAFYLISAMSDRRLALVSLFTQSLLRAMRRTDSATPADSIRAISFSSD
jgi:hypothetical protein